VYHSVLLASASPRRAALLRQIGVPFRAMPACVGESYPAGLSPYEGVEHVARAKALAVADTFQDRQAFAAVLGADTVVVLGDRVLGKPSDAAEAERMLRDLSGRTHRVLTGVALVWLDRAPDDAARIESWVEKTRVTFRVLHEAEIRAYVQSGRPLDKAGAYGIQENAAAFVSRIEGCYFNVVGLPLASLAERLLLPGEAR
jgi:septum formation protein